MSYRPNDWYQNKDNIVKKVNRQRHTNQEIHDHALIEQGINFVLNELCKSGHFLESGKPVFASNIAKWVESSREGNLGYKKKSGYIVFIPGKKN